MYWKLIGGFEVVYSVRANIYAKQFLWSFEE